MSTAVSSHSGAGPLSLMSCVRESSPPQDLGPEYEAEKSVSTKKRFWNPRKWFKRKNNKVADDIAAPNDLEPKETLRSRSTSELSEPEDLPKRRSGVPMHPGLSVSHDSVFHSPQSGSELELEGAHSSSSLSTHNVHGVDRLQTELVERLRLRRGRGDTSEDDEGLPRSPCNSPTATEKTANKDHPTKSHSTCSEGSLISMGSSEMDEDSSGQQSHHSSKISLQDKKSSDGDLELENVLSSSYPLNHSAAHHRVSVRPSRRHGAPRRRRGQQIVTTALPTTLEVNEDSSVRSVTPEITIREAVAELYSSTAVSKQSRFLTVNQLKCSSLPPGLASPNSDSNKLHRSRSNAGTKSHDEIGTLGEEDEPHDKKNESFLGKLFPIRRSGKKKKHSKEEKVKDDKLKEDIVDSPPIGAVSSPINMPPRPFPRSGAAARQRVIPNDIPASPELSPRQDELIFPKSSPEKSNLSLSPLHLELESRFQQRMASHSTTVSPKSPPNSPKSPMKSPILEKHFIKHSKVEIHERKSIEASTETNKSKVVIAGLSQFQKKAMSLHSEEKDYKSLTDFPKEEEKSKPIIVKSHSFKSAKNSNHAETTSKEPELTKSNSFESMKNSDGVTVEKQEKTEIVDVKMKHESEFIDSGITISGPSHKAIVSVGNNIESNMKVSEEIHHQVSVTKIQVKKESTHVIKSSGAVPEFMNVQLHKVEKPTNNVVLSTAFSKNEEFKPSKFVSSSTSEMECEVSKVVRTSTVDMEKSHIENLKTHSDNSKIQTEVIKSQNENSKLQNQNQQDNLSTPLDTLTSISEKSKIQISDPKKVKEKTTIQVKDKCKNQTADIEQTKNIQKIKTESSNFKQEKLERSTSMQKPKIELEKNKVKMERSLSEPQNSKQEIEQLEMKKIDVEKSKSESVRKFSKEDIEIIEKDDQKQHVTTALVTITTMTTPPKTTFKKPDNLPLRKSFVPINTEKLDKPVLKVKSSSLDMVEMKQEKDDKSSLKSDEKIELRPKTHSANDITDTNQVTYRRKSIINQKKDDEPELMKVFARRSLKLKDSESEALSQQVVKMIEEEKEASKSRDSDKENQNESPPEERKKKFDPEVTLRKPIVNNKIASSYQRAVSLNQKANEVNTEKMQKQYSLVERPKTEWIKTQDEIIPITEKGAFIEEDKPKNFNQRMAEWEKRAQAVRKTSP